MPTGTVGFTLAKIAPDASGVISIGGTIGFVLPKMAPASAGWTTITGTAAPELKAIALSATGWLPITGTAAVTLAKTSSAAAGGIGPSGTVAATLKALEIAEAGWISLGGPIGVTLTKTSSAATGKIGLTGTVAETLKKIALALSGQLTPESVSIIGEPELSMAVNNRGAATSYTIDHSDRERLIVFQSAAAVAVTLPEAVGAFGNGFRFKVMNLGAGVVTITPTTSTINGLADPVVLVQLDNVEFWSDGVNWYAIESPAP